MKPKTTIYVSETENDVLKSIAKDLNMTARRGQNTGEASVSRLNQGIASGEIICTLAKVTEPEESQGPKSSDARHYNQVDRVKVRSVIENLNTLGLGSHTRFRQKVENCEIEVTIYFSCMGNYTLSIGAVYDRAWCDELNVEMHKAISDVIREL